MLFQSKICKGTDRLKQGNTSLTDEKSDENDIRMAHIHAETIFRIHGNCSIPPSPRCQRENGLCVTKYRRPPFWPEKLGI